MPLFRFHRGSLEESLKTTIVVRDFQDLTKVMVLSDGLINDINGKWPFTMKIESYPYEGNNFDARIGWYTHAVLCNLYDEKRLDIIGFLSESLF